MAKIFVWDSNIFAKLLFEEPDTAQARDFVRACFQGDDTRILIPELFLYELASITQYYDDDILRTMNTLEAPLASQLIAVSPSKDVWVLAQKITRAGHKNSGYPSMYDSIYHAIAIKSDGVFVTADKKHFEKAKSFGHICLLQDWETLFDTP